GFFAAALWMAGGLDFAAFLAGAGAGFALGGSTFAGPVALAAISSALAAIERAMPAPLPVAFARLGSGPAGRAAVGPSGARRPAGPRLRPGRPGRRVQSRGRLRGGVLVGRLQRVLGQLVERFGFLLLGGDAHRTLADQVLGLALVRDLRLLLVRGPCALRLAV